MLKIKFVSNIEGFSVSIVFHEDACLIGITKNKISPKLGSPEIVDQFKKLNFLIILHFLLIFEFEFEISLMFLLVCK